MEFKECYVSKNGISCITNINTLHNFKKLKSAHFIKKFSNIIKRNNILFYITLRSCEYLYNNFIKFKIYNLIYNLYSNNYIKNLNENDLLCIMFS